MHSLNTNISLQAGKKIYFASDFHFGIPNYETSLLREKKVCAWLDSIKTDAQQIYLLGDLFDTWMEYKNVVPKYYTRFLGKIAELTDAGIEIIIFTGNHDVWMYGYFEKELNTPVIKKPTTIQINKTHFHIGHGDGVGPGDFRFKLLKKIMSSPISQYIYRLIHPSIGLSLADYLSRLGSDQKYEALQLKDLDKEEQIVYANMCLQHQKIDYFVFGHRHIPMELKLSDSSTFINLGDWITHYTYAVFDGTIMTLEKY